MRLGILNWSIVPLKLGASRRSHTYLGGLEPSLSNLVRDHLDASYAPADRRTHRRWAGNQHARAVFQEWGRAQNCVLEARGRKTGTSVRPPISSKYDLERHLPCASRTRGCQGPPHSLARSDRSSRQLSAGWANHPASMEALVLPVTLSCSVHLLGLFRSHLERHPVLFSRMQPNQEPRRSWGCRRPSPLESGELETCDQKGNGKVSADDLRWHRRSDRLHSLKLCRQCQFFFRRCGRLRGWCAVYTRLLSPGVLQLDTPPGGFQVGARRTGWPVRHWDCIFCT